LGSVNHGFHGFRGFLELGLKEIAVLGSVWAEMEMKKGKDQKNDKYS